MTQIINLFLIMAHFARIDKNTHEVLHVHVVNNDDAMNIISNTEDESIGVNYLKNVHSSQSWINDVYFKQCSYNGSVRKNYPGKGYFYDTLRDAFIAPRPFNSWTLNESTCKWDPPAPRPVGNYRWDENILNWVLIQN